MNSQTEQESITPIKILKSKPGSRDGVDNQKKLSQDLSSKIKLFDKNHKSEKETEAESDNIAALFFSKKNKSTGPCINLKFKDLIVESDNEDDEGNLELPLLLKLRKRRYTSTNTQISQGGILTLKNIAKKEHIQKNFEVIDKNKIIIEERANSNNLSDLKSKFLCCL